MSADDDWRIDLDALRDAITPATRVLVLNSPHNPTGAVLDEATLRRLAELAERHDLWVLSDEIYGPLTYDRRDAPSIASLPGLADRTIVLDGFSKAYAMTGWRLGYAVLPARVVEAVTAIVGDTATCTPAFVQRAGIAALTGPQHAVAGMVSQYGERRDALVACLRALPGVRVSTPSGALYAFADVSAVMARTGVASSAEVASQLLVSHGVACVAGSVFGTQGDCCLRMSFALAREELDAAIRKLDQWSRVVSPSSRRSPTSATRPEPAAPPRARTDRRRRR